MEQTQILPPAQTTKRGERAHVHAFSSLKNNENNKDENESQFSFTYVNENAGKAYAVTFLGRTQRRKRRLNTQHAKITCVCPFAPPFDTKKHMAASGASDGSIQIWSLETGALIKRHEKVLAGPVRDVCWSFDGAKVLLAGEGREQFAKCVDAETGTAVKDLSGATQSVHDSLREQEREAAQSYNRIGGFSSAILYRWAAVSVGTTRASEATNTHSRKVYKRSSNVQRR